MAESEHERTETEIGRRLFDAMDRAETQRKLWAIGYPDSDAFRAVYREVMQALAELNALQPEINAMKPVFVEEKDFWSTPRHHRMAAYTLIFGSENSAELVEGPTVWHCLNCGHTFATLGELIKGNCNA